MVAEARTNAEASALPSFDVVRGTAEDLPRLRLPPMRVVSFGQSFHRTDRVPVAQAVHDVLQPGGAMVLVVHDATRPAPQPPPDIAAIPHAEIRQLVQRYLGRELRSGARSAASYGDERFEDTVARTRFGPPRRVHAPGRPDIVRDVDGVIAGYLSMSFAAPHLFGPRIDEFVADLRRLLVERSASGRYWDWPGDTEVVIAVRG
jgi:hypothetical protein